MCEPLRFISTKFSILHFQASRRLGKVATDVESTLDRINCQRTKSFRYLIKENNTDTEESLNVASVNVDGSLNGIAACQISTKPDTVFLEDQKLIVPFA